MATCDPKRNKTFQTTLKINDKEIELNDFIQILFAETVIGMVKALRGVEKVQTLSLKISKET